MSKALVVLIGISFTIRISCMQFLEAIQNILNESLSFSYIFIS